MNLACVAKSEERYAIRMHGAFFFMKDYAIDEWEGVMEITDELFERSFLALDELKNYFGDEHDAIKIVKTEEGYRACKINGEPLDKSWL